ncbi:MAG: hypothetical protein KBF99_20905 [Leptospiraceae bacterium]|nr:hypothetical protein [Leptospiraceae bacterium]MBK7056702.1 hypothetical protein [Leptospiraceae bacterium]MBK9498306.1 hypothetical protein [Leptospiraceae bacterium]MBL0262976.1 hypothetical protein [Leptospiraceae bacterium]MBP9165657.1 hypothetical protein [Leptospiraceae bacterium]
MDIAIFIIILLGFIFVGLRESKKVKDDSSYLLANRKTGLFALVATLVMTEFNTSTLLGFSAAGYTTGIWGLTLPLVFLIGLGFYTFTVARKWKKLNGMSVAELFSLRYGNGVGTVASLFLILAMIGFSATYVKSMTVIFQPFVPELNSFIVSALLVAVVLFMTLRGGLVSVISTDILGFIGTLIVIPMIFYFSYSQTHARFEDIVRVFPPESSNALPIRYVASLIIITMFTYIAAPWYGQKIFAAASEKTAFIAVGISSVLVYILYSFPILALTFLRIKGIIGINPEEGIPYIIKMYFPEGLRAVAFAVLFAAAATTLSGIWSALTTMLVGDYLLSAKNPKLGKDYVGSMKIYFAFAVISWLLGNIFVDKILNKLILANIPIAALSFSLLAGFYWEKASRTGAIISISAGLVWGIGCYAYLGEDGGYTWFWAAYGIPLIFGSGIIGSLVFPKSAEEEKLLENFNLRMKAEVEK